MYLGVRSPRRGLTSWLSLGELNPGRMTGSDELEGSLNSLSNSMLRQHQYTRMCWVHKEPIRIQINSFITPIIFNIIISMVKTQAQFGMGLVCVQESSVALRAFLRRMNLLIPRGIFFIHHCRLLSATYYIM